MRAQRLRRPLGALPLLRRLEAALARLAVRRGQAAGDHLRDAVAAHAHAVQAVGGVHRPALVGHDDELGSVAVAAQQLQEAVDVGVVERGLDLVEDVERARAREEDGEQECQRDQRLLAARHEGEPLGRLACRRHLDLYARIARGGRCLLLFRRFGRLAAGRPGLFGGRPVLHLAAEHGPRAVGLHEPQATATPRKQMRHDVLEVPRGRLERLVEGLPDTAIRLADQAAELRHRRLEVRALGLEVLDVRDRLLVLLRRERVHRTELLAPARDPLDAALELGSALVVEALVEGPDRGVGGIEPELAGDRAALALRLGGRVARLLRADLGRGHGLRGLAEAGLDLGLVARAGPQLGGRRLAALFVCGELALRGLAALGYSLERGAHGPGAPFGGPRKLRLRRGPPPQRLDPARTVRPSASGLLRELALGAQLGDYLRPPDGVGAVAGAPGAALDHPLGPALGLGGLVALTARRAKGALRAVAAIDRGHTLGPSRGRRLAGAR